VASLTAAICGTKTYVNNPFSFSHGPLMMTDKERAEARVTEGLIRLRFVVFELRFCFVFFMFVFVVFCSTVLKLMLYFSLKVSD
jgi:hypothetical protein